MGNGRPVVAGVDDPPIARAGGGSEKQIGHRRGQTAASHAARGHAAASQPAGTCRTTPDPANRRRHAADGCRARSARARRPDRSGDRGLCNLAGDDGRKNRGPHINRRRQHREIFRAVHDLRIFEAPPERRCHALDRKPAGDRHGAARLRSRLCDHGAPSGRHRHGRSPDRRSPPCDHRADKPSPGAKIPHRAERACQRNFPDARARIRNTRPDGATVRNSRHSPKNWPDDEQQRNHQAGRNCRARHCIYFRAYRRNRTR